MQVRETLITAIIYELIKPCLASVKMMAVMLMVTEIMMCMKLNTSANVNKATDNNNIIIIVKLGSHLRHNDITGRSRKRKKCLVLMFYVASVNNILYHNNIVGT